MSEIVSTLSGVFLAFWVNTAFGLLVWTWSDDKRCRLHQWYASCPKDIAWFAQPLALSLWPMAFWMRFRLMREDRQAGAEPR
jgi:hypothetical protein